MHSGRIALYAGDEWCVCVRACAHMQVCLCVQHEKANITPCHGHCSMSITHLMNLPKCSQCDGYPHSQEYVEGQSNGVKKHVQVAWQTDPVGEACCEVATPP